MSLAALVPTSARAASVPDLVTADVHFEVPGTEIIPGVAAVRASCDVNASGETLVLLANGTARTAIGASAGPCTIVLTLFGVDVALPVFNTTPLGRSSFYLPGISTVTIGIADLSVDLMTSLNSTSRVAGDIANATPEEVAWGTWGAQRLLVHGMDGVGSVADSALNTTFTYTMSLGLTVYALSIELYHVDLVRIGSFPGTPSLLTPLSVDLRPHALSLEDVSDLAYDRATFSWSGTVDSDVDHLELWLTDSVSNVSYRLAATATHTQATLRPSTHYEARIVSVDRAGQLAASPGIAFETPAAPAPPSAPPLEAQGNAGFTWTMVALAALTGIVGYAWGFLRGRKSD